MNQEVSQQKIGNFFHISIIYFVCIWVELWRDNTEVIQVYSDYFKLNYHIFTNDAALLQQNRIASNQIIIITSKSHPEWKYSR